MTFEHIQTPLALLRSVLGVNVPDDPLLTDYQAWWETEGDALPPDQAFAHGQALGVVWRTTKQETPICSLALGYITAFYAPDLWARYAAALTVVNMVHKYADAERRGFYFPTLTAHAESAWRGAVWLGGRDDVDVTAHPAEDGWRLLGERARCADLGADVMLVSARPEGSARSALFLVPRRRDDGSPNVQLSAADKAATFDESEAHLLGTLDGGSEIIREARNVLWTADILASVAVTQRALVEMQKAGQFEDESVIQLGRAFVLAWEVVELCNWTWWEVCGVYSDTYRLWELMTHLAGMRAAMLAASALSMVNREWAAAHGVARWIDAASDLNAWAVDDRERLAEGALLLDERKDLLYAYFAPYVDAAALESGRAHIQAQWDALFAHGSDTAHEGARAALQTACTFAAGAAAAKFERARMLSQWSKENHEHPHPLPSALGRERRAQRGRGGDIEN